MAMEKSWKSHGTWKIDQTSWNFVIRHGILPFLPPNCTKFVCFCHRYEIKHGYRKSAFYDVFLQNTANAKLRREMVMENQQMVMDLLPNCKATSRIKLETFGPLDHCPTISLVSSEKRPTWQKLTHEAVTSLPLKVSLLIHNTESAKESDICKQGCLAFLIPCNFSQDLG